MLDTAEAREVFNDARRDMVELYGRGFALNYPDVAVRLFDVDYWSEKGREGRAAQVRLLAYAQTGQRRLLARGRAVERAAA